MRDWRNDQVRAIDIRTIDIMTAAHNLLDTSEPYTLLSGYRSPATNAMLRSRSSGVARNSLHMQGEAADLRVNFALGQPDFFPGRHAPATPVASAATSRSELSSTWTAARSAAGAADPSAPTDGPCPCASQPPCETRFRDRSAHWTDAPRRPYPATETTMREKGHDALHQGPRRELPGSRPSNTA